MIKTRQKKNRTIEGHSPTENQRSGPVRKWKEGELTKTTHFLKRTEARADQDIKRESQRGELTR